MNPSIKSFFAYFTAIFIIFSLLPNFAFARTCAESAIYYQNPINVEFDRSGYKMYQNTCNLKINLSPEQIDKLIQNSETGNQLSPEKRDKLFQKPTGGKGGIGETPTGGQQTSQRISISNPLGVNTFADLIAKINNWLIWIGVPIFTLMIFIGAFQIMIAGSTPDKMTKGRHTITYAVIGYALLLISTGITTIIKNVLGMQ